jgi:hypothetical protein
MIPIILVAWIWSELTMVAGSEYFTEHESDTRTSLGIIHFSQENTPETESQL